MTCVRRVLVAKRQWKLARRAIRSRATTHFLRLVAHFVLFALRSLTSGTRPAARSTVVANSFLSSVKTFCCDSDRFASEFCRCLYTCFCCGDAPMSCAMFEVYDDEYRLRRCCETFFPGLASNEQCRAFVCFALGFSFFFLSLSVLFPPSGEIFFHLKSALHGCSRAECNERKNIREKFSDPCTVTRH